MIALRVAVAALVAVLVLVGLVARCGVLVGAWWIGRRKLGGAP